MLGGKVLPLLNSVVLVDAGEALVLKRKNTAKLKYKVEVPNQDTVN